MITHPLFARILPLFAIAAIASSQLPAASASAEYRVVGRYEVGGDAYDYLRVDPANRRLYVSNATRVVVLDVDTGQKVGEIAPTLGVHGIALAPEFNHGFTSNAGTRSVTMFDLKTLKVLKEIKYTGVKPDGIEYDPKTKQVFVANGSVESGDMTIINAKTGAIVGTVQLSGKLEAMAFDGRGRLFINAEDKGVIHVVDTGSLKLEATWPIAPGEGASGLAIDPANHLVFATCGNQKMIVLNSDTGAVVAALPIGKGTDAATFNPATSEAFSSNFDGTLTVVQERGADNIKVVQNMASELGARTLALDSRTGRLFLTTAKFGPKPEPTKEAPHPRRPLIPGSVAVLVVDSK